MVILFAVLGALATAGVVATVRDLIRDGYRRVPAREPSTLER